MRSVSHFLIATLVFLTLSGCGSFEKKAGSLLQKGHCDEAIEMYRRGLRRNAFNAGASNGLARAYFLKTAFFYGPPEHEKIYAVGGLPTTPAKIARISFLRAIAQAKQSITIDPSSAEPHVLLGQIYYVLGRYHDAFGEADQALKRSPANAQARYVAGASSEAIARDFLKQRPWQPSLTDKVVALLDRAWAEFDRAASLSPDLGESLIEWLDQVRRDRQMLDRLNGGKKG